MTVVNKLLLNKRIIVKFINISAENVPVGGIRVLPCHDETGEKSMLNSENFFSDERLFSTVAKLEMQGFELAL